jgi:hypothetical protein
MMTRALLIACLVLIPAVLASPPYNTVNGRRTAPVYPREAKTYDIDLDGSYEDQWKPIIADFQNEIVGFVNGLGLSEKLPLKVLDLYDYSIVESYDAQFAQEVKAISTLLNLSFTEIVVLNLIYDITAQCTSIVIQDPEGNIYHGRNLDFPFAPQLSQMVYHGRYFRNGTLLYEALSLAGYTGLITGVKPNAYSFSIDQYVLYKNATLEDQLLDAVLDIAQAVNKKLSPPILAKRAFETVGDYDELIDYLKSSETLSRVFYIVAGVESGQGAAITRFRRSVENITSLNPSAGDWYVVQTNFIGDVPDPLFDNRATAARDWLNSIGVAQISKDVLLNQVMSVYPVFNNETIHTTVMQPNNGYFNTTIWGW